ncbi:ABC transporter permease [Arcanobacterium haemolyticum]|uniref:Binding-protein-dependent transport systems inner membrane component n=1 Tax=Arcanobacterium haemolyticum (strain ATCC 9345 / DSM 20595 / CCM 5947 / CCUG 17215 / LMG 16163 / NBRC 15585 / NCTC 8452 / 11018) TaxID=644284 RepID=D7BNT8_ARCHD|nr:ABC transporter permease [Arcanobacterium haemolyticum]ADH92587.1 binding-protein-dependent transport systems inner membrane component [Arcanobacterium haemolyticum DSM 20595]QCX46705.1 ABC transporter permease [Arcanobacterium haemolyticum]SPT74435.1 Putative aliphatic sulfonates transport permease protein ssuC [Arcanobacterium haemolyticum]SQH28679.1 Putative aliphatic sulfonates transport permease protein ssuC [Arcanobacterium haemolyticum]
MQRSRIVAPIVVAVVLLLLWVGVSRCNLVSAFALPDPVSVFTRLVRGISDGYLLASAWQTLHVAVIGSLTAALIGIPVGFGIAHFAPFSAALEPFLAASQAIPAVAFAPLLVLWVGYGTTPIVLLCVLMVVFPIIINTAVGVRDVDPDLIAAARLDGASGMRLMSYIEFPLALPGILAGIRTGFTLSVTGAVVGELVIGGQRGLGIELSTAQHLTDAPGMFAAIAILAVLAVGIYLALRALETRVLALVS